MVAIQRVLFLTDFSPTATDALAYAREFAEKFSARIQARAKLLGKLSGVRERVCRRG